jgi:hypothetical protein
MSEIITDTITGKSTATTITIGSTPVVSASANSMTIRGEGSNQTSIQQGLAKVWCNWDNDATGIVDSLNVSSFTDVGTGDTRLVYTTNMGNATYCIATSSVHDAGAFVCVVSIDHDNAFTSSQIDFDLMQTINDSRQDTEMNMMQVTGDLA